MANSNNEQIRTYNVNGINYLVHRIPDQNPLPQFLVYRANDNVQVNAIDIARKLGESHGVHQENPNGDHPHNTRVMWNAIWNHQAIKFE